jgi:hypothetical protein
MNDTQQPAPVATEQTCGFSGIAPGTPLNETAAPLPLVSGMNPWRTSAGNVAEMLVCTLPRECGPVAFLAHTGANRGDFTKPNELSPNGEPFLLLVVREGHEQADADALRRELAAQTVPTLYKDPRYPDGRAVAPSEVFGRTLFVAAFLIAPQKPLNGPT